MRPSFWRDRFRALADSLIRYFYGPQGVLARKRTAIRALLILVVIFAAFFNSRPTQPDLMQQILDRGELSVGFRLGPLIYFERDDEIGGLDYYILQSFANSLGLKLKPEILDELPDLLDEVSSGEIDIAAANLSITPERQNVVRFSSPYTNVVSILIQHSSRPPLHSLDEIQGASLIAIEGSSHAELLRSLKPIYPNLNWQEEAGVLMFQLMERIQNREIDYAVVDSSIYELERAFFPRVEIAQRLDEGSSLAFALERSEDRSLVQSLDSFLAEFQQSGQLDQLMAEIYSNSQNYSIADSLALRDRIRSRLPEFEELFRKVGSEFDMDWVMLAAVAYQESHWNPSARSYTGVRGLMMLTLPTAGQYGVTNRLDAEQSLRGGTQHLKSLIRRLPSRIGEPDRTKLALAAYNMGMGHLEDARILTQRAGKNPDIWEDVRAHLHLLQQSQYYQTVDHGYARGLEARSYVDNIYQFYNILESYAWQKALETWNFDAELGEEMTPGFAPDFPSILENPLSPL
jgi:membrane-bound lytic murein transglycosylase F